MTINIHITEAEFSINITVFFVIVALLASGSTGTTMALVSNQNSSSHSSNSNPGQSSQQVNTEHCDRPGYPSCSILGSEAGKISPGTSCPPDHSKVFCNAYEAASGTSANNNNQPGSSSQKADAAHCDQPGWPSCYSLGFQAGKANPGSSCPTGHSQAFCNGYQYGSGGNGRGYIQGVTDPTHCDQPGFAACYDVGYHDGYNNAINEHHQFNTSCPIGHSNAFCKGYVPGYNRGISYNLGYSQGVNNANHDWNSSNQDIHAFNYDCPSGHPKDFCNGYTDGYGDYS